MKLKFLFLNLLVFTPTLSYARVIRVNECIVSLGGFCVIESIIGAILAVIILGIFFFFLGWPIKKFIKVYLEKKLKSSPNYKPNKFLIWLYQNAGMIMWLVISIIITFVIMN